MSYKDLFPACQRVGLSSAGRYLTGHLLALDEHPQYRHQIIELFADAEGGFQVSHSGGDLEGASGAFSNLPPTGGLRGASLGERMIGDIDFLVKEKKLKVKPSRISFAALN